MKRDIQAALGRRVYEYVDEDGVVYYSFHKHSGTITPALRLRLQSRLGTHLINFLVQMREVGRRLGLKDLG